MSRLLGRVDHPLHSLTITSLPPHITVLPDWLLTNVSVEEFKVLRSNIRDVDETLFVQLEHKLVCLVIQEIKLTYVPRDINKISTSVPWTWKGITSRSCIRTPSTEPVLLDSVLPLTSSLASLSKPSLGWKETSRHLTWAPTGLGAFRHRL